MAIYIDITKLDKYKISCNVSYSGSLASTNQWSYTCNIPFQANLCTVNRVTYYNSGSDTTTYTLRSPLFARDPSGIACTFTERDYDTHIHSPHWVDNPRGNTFTMTVLGADGTTKPSGGTVTLDMTFYEIK